MTGGNIHLRGWGHFSVLHSSQTYRVKRLWMLEGRRTSLQSHAGRSETWTVVQGAAMVHLSGAKAKVGTGDTCFIPVGAVHCLENEGPGPLVVIETWWGERMDEDDIERFEEKADAP